MVRVFVSELLSGGGWNDAVTDAGLAAEGCGMLLAVLEDLGGLPGVEPVTTWHAGLGPFPLAGVHATVVSGPSAEAMAFDLCSASSDWTLVIAPEFDGHLESRSQKVLARGGRLLGSSPEAVALAGDKYLTAEAWKRCGLPTIPTFPVTRTTFQANVPLPLQPPFVIKPRHGAGSLSTHVIHTQSEYRAMAGELALDPMLSQAVVQPYRGGVAASLALICPDGNGPPIPLPPALQLISTDGRLKYMGGSLTWPSTTPAELDSMVALACQAIPGLRGYVGIDILLLEDGRTCEFVELNPRLTTSYLGYRKLAESGAHLGNVLSGGNRLAAAILNPVRAGDLTWRNTTVRFGGI